MFRKIMESVTETNNFHDLNESLSKAELDRMRGAFVSADIRPTDFDRTFEAWLLRIGQWGKIEIVHVDPEFKVKKKISSNVFIKKATDSNLQKLFGVWDINKLDVNKVELFREYIGLNGKRQRESFFVTVKLKPELKKAIR